MQFRRAVGMGVLVGLLLLTGVILGVLVWHSPSRAQCAATTILIPGGPAGLFM